ncbi:MAG: hypothetical protein JSW06_09520 [Thermoplasmatales archaeon]|nr:MAG: hypothetical protein JSW06_09520 [Thermoplasmatales archaeon]
MNKKILLGSILSVIILILVSFTSVIGYRSVESDVKVSPLFNIRSSKAIGKESKDITCDYVGKGEESILSIPRLDTRRALLIDRISRMDDKSYNMLLAQTINYLTIRNQLKDKNIGKIITSIHHLRNNPEQIKEYLIIPSRENGNRNIVEWQDYTLYSEWIPRCLIEIILYILSEIVFGVFFFLSWIPDCSNSFVCPP